MEFVPVGPDIQFLEPQSTNVFLYIHGHVVGSSSADAASAFSAAKDAGAAGA
jgi:hypothetical protein